MQTLDEKAKEIMRRRLEEQGYGQQLPASFLKFINGLGCSCGGEAHDECRNEEEE